jgi:hypothetical protein
VLEMSGFGARLGRQTSGVDDVGVARSVSSTVDVLMIGTGEYTTGYVHGGTWCNEAVTRPWRVLWGKNCDLMPV